MVISKDTDIYDILLLGAGPAGLTAAIYGARANYNVMVIEHMVSGGMIATTEKVENYPGFPEGVGGIELGQYLEKQAKRFGASLTFATANSVSIKDKIKKVETSNGIYKSKSLIIATGTSAQSLGVPGEDKLQGQGISYCATCDGPFFKDQTVAVVGGGDAAVEEALYLTRFASKVIIIHRRDKLRATSEIQEKAFANKTIQFAWDSIVQEIEGNTRVDSITIQNVKTGQQEKLSVNGVFIYIGRTPNTTFISDIEKNQQGYIITNEQMETSQPGIFAAGDVREKTLRQIVTATADGALAAISAANYLEK